MDWHLAGHFTLAGQFTAEVLGGFEAPTGDQLAIEVGKAQFQQRERLGEGRTVVDDRVDDQCTVEVRVAAHHQVAALDPGNIDTRRYIAADLRADLLEPGAILVLTGQFVKVIPDVLTRQGGGGQQHQEYPQQAFAPVGLGLFPVQLQRVVDQVEQRFLARRAAGDRAQARFVALVQIAVRGVEVVVRVFCRQVFARRFVKLGHDRLLMVQGVVQVVIKDIRVQ
ncbi:hypothetical protein D3C79_629570 [compost metagenome]